MIETAKSIIKQVDKATNKDFVFILLCSAIQDKDEAYHIAYGKSGDAKAKLQEEHILKLRELMLTFGLGESNGSSITRSENMEELVDMLKRIKAAVANGDLEVKDALNMEKDIRVKLQDKFDIQEEIGQQRIVVVPAKHDLICPHTHRECYQMPTLEACCEYYGINLKQ